MAGTPIPLATGVDELVAAEAPSGFGTNVFVNCPFDSDYHSLLRPLLFTIVYLGFTPRIALERSNSAESRIAKICDLMLCSRYGIHDLSRLKSKAPDEYYRLNMAFELGIDYALRLHGPAHCCQKRCLILETDRFEFMKAISDLSGVDIKAHEDKPERIVRAVRDWLVENVPLTGVATGSAIWYRFTDFTSAFYDDRKAEGCTDEDLDMMPVPEYIDHIRRWLPQA